MDKTLDSMRKATDGEPSTAGDFHGTIDTGAVCNLVSEVTDLAANYLNCSLLLYSQPLQTTNSGSKTCRLVTNNNQTLYYCHLHVFS